MRRNFQERLLFLRSFLAHPRQVGAILPTSRRAVGDMLDMADLPAARCVVELGGGAGAHGGPFRGGRPPAPGLLFFETPPAPAPSLSSRYDDPRLEVFAESA